MRLAVRYSEWITLALLTLASFAFFFWAYPYHLFHKEQTTLFLYNAESVAAYFERPAWLACLAGDFLTQFFYYIGGGPLVVSLVLSLLGLLTYDTVRRLTGRRMAVITMALVMIWEAGRLCGLVYPLSSTLALMGGLFLFGIYLRIKEMKIRVPAGIVCLVAGYGCFGYGAWIFLAFVTLSELKERRWVLAALFLSGVLVLPAGRYPATSWWGKADLDREYVLALDVETYFGNSRKVERLAQENRSFNWATYYYNLHNASQGVLSQRLLAHYQPATLGLFLPVDPSASYLSIQFANELWFQLGDMTMAEHCAMLSMIFSPRRTGSRMIKRLAEINLVNGDREAALKYLRILDKTWLYKGWARKRMADIPTENLRAWLEMKRSLIPTTDTLRQGNDVVTSLRNLLASHPGNKMAYEYLLCYHLLSKNIDAFAEDYVPGEINSRLYAEALLIHLARRGKIGVEELKQYQIPPETFHDFETYIRLYDKHQGDGTSLQKEYGRTYWFYYHYATFKQEES